MNAAHFHLLINHVPIFSILFGTLALVWFYFSRDKAPLRILVMLFLAGAVSAVVAVQTGESAEDLVEDLPGVTHDIVHDHEESGEKGQIAAIVLGLFSLLVLWMARRHSIHLTKAILILGVIALLANAIMARTAWLGGMVRHTEIR